MTFGIARPPSLAVGLWSLAAGIAQVALWPLLPGSIEGAGLLLTGFLGVAIIMAIAQIPAVGVVRWVAWSVVLPFVFGACWALLHNHQVMADRLPDSLHGTDHRLTVEVESLPQTSPAVSRFWSGSRSSHGHRDARFSVRVIEAELPELIGQRVRLSWYRASPEQARKLSAGSRWNLTARLKRPRGSVNPHTFDYESWLLQQEVFATGYVRDQKEAPEYLEPGSGIAALRERLRDRMTGAAPGWEALPQQALIRALLLGDKGGIDADTRDLLRRTGTAHLLAISGLHVGMVAGIFLLLGGLVSRCVGLVKVGRVTGGSPLLWSGAAGVIAATGYTLISGAPLSAQRALVMTVVVVAALVTRRKFGAGLPFGLALAVVLMLQPLAVLNAGFWLSFVAVGALLLRFQGRDDREGKNRRAPHEPVGEGWFLKGAALCRGALQSQWAILVGLLLPSVLIFSGVSASGLLLNLVAIPWVGLFILPLIFAGALLPGPIAGLLWSLADWQLSWLLEFLVLADSRLPGWQSVPIPSGTILVIAIFSSLVLLLPRGFPARRLGWCLAPVLLAGLLPPSWQRDRAAFFEVTVLDVGQGLAVVATTERQRMLFDTGASSGSGWSAGGSIVAPYLLARSGPQLDLLAVSHGDRDHAGGVEGVLAQMEVETLAAPGLLESRLGRSGLVPVGAQGRRPCLAGKSEELGELTVQWLWPESVSIDGEENDHSCVALLSWRGVRVLLTGDISSRVEARLVAAYPGFAPVDLLVAPHHGSRTSSSRALVRWARPTTVVFSAGYRHHFGHPHPEVVDRYHRSGALLFNTAESGAVTVLWAAADIPPHLRCARDAPRFWLSERPSCGAQTRDFPD